MAVFFLQEYPSTTSLPVFVESVLLRCRIEYMLHLITLERTPTHPQRNLLSFQTLFLISEIKRELRI